MVRLKLVLLVTLTTLLIGCVLPITVVGPVGARIDSSEVVIYYP